MLENFKERKLAVLEIVNEVNHDSDLSKEAIAESDLINSVNRLEEGTFRIALVAPFSAGKSTFINGLIGRDLLSMDLRAETAAITTLKYGEERKVEIFYRDGRKEVMSSSTLTDEDLKQLLKTKTAVRRDANGDEIVERVEDSIKKVDVYWDLPLCKGGVEIIDTPGLFSRHEQHSEITGNILPTINAVLFLIEPSNVGQKHFMEVISERVEDAKHSSLEREGRHIFFVLNKIDMYTESEVATARFELLEVLKPLLPAPQIFEVSSYFAMKSRMFKNSHIELADLQRDKHIKFTDHEGFPVAGRALQEEHVNYLLQLSKVNIVESELASYLEDKNNFLIEDVINNILSIYNRQISDMQQSIDFNENMKHKEREAYSERLKETKDFFNKVSRDLEKSIEITIQSDFHGGTKGDGDLNNIVESVSKVMLPGLIEDLEKRTWDYWNSRKDTLTKKNAKEQSRKIVERLVETMDNQIVINNKKLIQKVYEELKKGLNQTARKIANHFEGFEVQVNNVFEEKLELTSADYTSFFNIDSLVKQMEKEIEENFSQSIIKMSTEYKESIDFIFEQNERSVVKKGIINKVKSWGLVKFLFNTEEEREVIFELYDFKQDMTDFILSLSEETSEKLRQENRKIAITIKRSLYDVIQTFQEKISRRVEAYKNWRNRVITDMENNLQNKESLIEETILEKKVKIKKLNEKAEQLSVQQLDEAWKEVASSGV